jgi:predicted Zn finger-like uncharacterized protein
MDIHCGSCNTEYEFDTDLIPTEGIRVKCEVCQNIFLVQAPSGGKTVEKAATNEKDEEQTFKIRQPSGKILKFTELETLTKWILQGTISPEDEIASSGDKWAKLKYLPELEDVFAEVKSRNIEPVDNSTIDSLSAEESSTYKIKGTSGDTEDKKQEPIGEIVPDDSSNEPEFDSDMEFGSELEPGLLDQAYDEHFEPMKKSAKWPWVLGFFVLVLGGSLGGLLYLDVITNPFSKKTKETMRVSSPESYDDSSDIKNSKKIIAQGTKDAYQKGFQFLIKCNTPRCQAYAAFSKSMEAFNLSMELELLTMDATPDSQLKNEMASIKKSLVTIAAVSKKHANTVLDNDKNIPQALGAVLIADILQNNPIEKMRFDKITREHSNDIYILFAKGFQLSRSGMYKEALKTLSQLKTNDKTQTLAIPSKYLKAFILIKSGKSKPALNNYIKLCKERPTMVAVCSFSKQLSVSLLNTNSKIVKPTKLASKNPSMKTPGPTSKQEEEGSYDKFYMLAQQAYKMGQKDRAKKYYLKAYAKDPTSADPLNGAAWCYMDLGNASKAVKYFRKTLALIPHFGRARYGLAEALYQSGNKKAALKEYNVYISRHSAGRHGPRVRLQIKKLEAALGINVPAPMVIVIPPKPDPVDTTPPIIKKPTPPEDAMKPAPPSDAMKPAPPSDAMKPKPVVIVKPAPTPPAMDPPKKKDPPAKPKSETKPEEGSK